MYFVKVYMLDKEYLSPVELCNFSAYSLFDKVKISWLESRFSTRYLSLNWYLLFLWLSSNVSSLMSFEENIFVYVSHAMQPVKDRLQSIMGKLSLVARLLGVHKWLSAFISWLIVMFSPSTNYVLARYLPLMSPLCRLQPAPV